MAVINDRAVWVTAITQIDPNDPVQGGKGGVDNVPHEQLADRTKYLKQEVDRIQGESDDSVTLAALLKRIKELEDAPAIKLPYLPVGAIFETKVVYTSGNEVAAAMGYGKWQAFSEGRVTVGVSSKSADPGWTKVIGATHGEYDHTLTLPETPSHKHSPNNVFNKFTALFSDFKKSSYVDTSSNNTAEHFEDALSDSELVIKYTGNKANLEEVSQGGGQAHNNTQPSVVVGKWVRTA